MTMSRRRPVIVIDSSSSSDDEEMQEVTGRRQRGRQSITSICSTTDEENENENEHDNQALRNKKVPSKDGDHDALVEDLTGSLAQAKISATGNRNHQGKKLFSSNKDQRKAAAKKTFDKMGLSYLSSSNSDDSSCKEIFQPTFSNYKSKSSLKNQEIICLDDDDDNECKSSSASHSTRAKTATASWVYDKEYHEYYLKSNTKKFKIPGLRIPNRLYEELYEHQKEGVSWMAGLHSGHIGGLLGDEMGLGKTYMTLTLLGGLMREKTIRNALIIAPVSVLRSWEKEANNVLKRCERRVKISVVSSDQEPKRRRRNLKEALNPLPNQPQLIITTYGLVRSSTDSFCDERSCWDYVVLDEAHGIKNATAQVSKSCRNIANDPRTHRLILTGTPIMNNLRELWALFDFATSGRVLGPQKK